MAKTTTEKRLSVEEQIKQLENERKRLLQKEKEEERKARTHRLCKRGGIVEKLLPELATLADEQFDVFVKKVLLSEHTKRVIAELAAETPIITAPVQGSSELPKNAKASVPEAVETDGDVE